MTKESMVVSVFSQKIKEQGKTIVVDRSLSLYCGDGMGNN